MSGNDDFDFGIEDETPAKSVPTTAEVDAAFAAAVAETQPVVTGPPAVVNRPKKQSTAERIAPASTDLVATAALAAEISVQEKLVRGMMEGLAKIAPTAPPDKIRRAVGEFVSLASRKESLRAVLTTDRGRTSVLRAIATAVNLGCSLEPHYQHLWLIPRKDELVAQPGVGLARRAIEAAGCRVVTHIVYEGEAVIFDPIRSILDTGPLNFMRSTKGRAIIGGIGLALRGSEIQTFVIFSADHIDQLRAIAPKDSPWNTWAHRMVERSLVMRLARQLPTQQGSLLGEVLEMEGDSYVNED